MKLLLTAVFLLLASCASSPIFGERFGQMAPGMKPAEVKNLLGNPDGFQRDGEFEIYKYTDRMVSGFGWDKGNYQVVFKNNEVVEYGIGSMRYREWVPPVQPARTDVYIHEAK